METNLRATFVGLSLVLSFFDDEQNHFYDPKIGNTVGSEIDYLGAECDEIVVALKVLGYYHSKGHPRESYSKAFKMDLEAVRPDTLTPLVEYRLNIAFLPMLLHLHQCQLDFLVDFFGTKNSLNDQFPNRCQDLEGL